MNPLGKISGPLWLAAAAVFLTSGYVQNSRPGWNVNSQFALTCAIVERHTLSIDAYHLHPDMLTQDKAFFEGRFYSDKSPVTAFLGVPAFAAYRAIVRSKGEIVSYPSARYWTTWLTIGLCAASLTMLGGVLLGRHGVGPRAAAALGALWILSTPLLGYSILFYNYVPASAFALGGYLLVERRLRGEGSGAGHEALRFGFAGLLLALASWTLPTFALLPLILTPFLFWPRRRASGESESPKSPSLRLLVPWIGGAAIVACGYAAYSISIFGRITSPYRYEYLDAFRVQMEQGLMGAGWPDWRVLGLITFHPFRGLFVLFPATLAALVGLLVRALSRKGEDKRAVLVALGVLVGLLVYNGGYFMWWGGWTYAPRHLIPALPLLAMGLAAWIGRADGEVRTVRTIGTFGLITLMFASAVINFGVIALDPQPPPELSEESLYDPASVEQWPTPFVTVLRHVLEGNTDPNWGTRIGLEGAWSLAPVIGLWLACGAAILLWPTGKRETRTSEPTI